MKDSKEKEHRISNLKDMLDKVSNDNNARNSFEEEQYEEFPAADDDDYEVVDAEEMINTLSKDYNKYPKEELRVDEEFIYKPGASPENQDISSNGEEINENFIIKTKLEDSEFPVEERANFDIDTKAPYEYDDDDFVSEKFDSFFSKKIRGYSIVSLIFLALGIIFLIISVVLFMSSTTRIVDNVTSGEMNTSGVMFLLVGLFLLLISIYKMRLVKNPFEDVVDSINNIDKDKKDYAKNNAPEDSIEQKPLANDNKQVKKLGEFDIADFKSKVGQQKEELDGIKHKTEQRHDIPKQQKTLSKTEETSLEEEMEYEKALLDNESIDDIFADMDEIEEVPIISIDSKEK